MPRHREMYLRVCLYCGRNFMAKRKTTVACYSEPCQRKHECARRRKGYERDLAKQQRQEVIDG